MSLSANTPFSLDVVVLGAAAMDHLAWVADFPGPDEIVLARRSELQPGGAAANVAVAIARLGLSCGFHGQLGEDEYGRKLRTAFELEGVDVSACAMRRGQHTALCLITVAANGQRSMVSLGGVGSLSDPTELDRHYLASAKFIYMTDLCPEIVDTVIATDGPADRRIIFSPGGLYSVSLLENFSGAIRTADILILSQSEANQAFPQTDAQNVPALLSDLGARNAIVTLGSKGVSYAGEDGITRLPSFATKDVEDSTGAGDAFAGGLIAGLARGESALNAIPYGLAAASISISKTGARAGLPTIQQLMDRLEEK